jgi:dihydrofolate reductase
VTKYVATHSAEPLTWQNSCALGSDVVAALRTLKKEDGPDLLIQGSSDLIQTMLANDLIDEFRLLIFPLELGRGKKLFGSGTMPAAFKLTGSKASSRGVLIASFERAGKVTTGSFALEQPTEAEIERRKKLS